jgi:hypothetical protein
MLEAPRRGCGAGLVAPKFILPGLVPGILFRRPKKDRRDKPGDGVETVDGGGRPYATPLSAMSCFSSPDWNISIMMSDPPTNSPLT